MTDSALSRMVEIVSAEDARTASATAAQRQAQLALREAHEHTVDALEARDRALADMITKFGMSIFTTPECAGVVSSIFAHFQDLTNMREVTGMRRPNAVGTRNAINDQMRAEAGVNMGITRAPDKAGKLRTHFRILARSYEMANLAAREKAAAMIASVFATFLATQSSDAILDVSVLDRVDMGKGRPGLTRSMYTLITSEDEEWRVKFQDVCREEHTKRVNGSLHEVVVEALTAR